MSKAKFAAAKELIDEKKYDEARGVLRTIDHPAAREWETKLDAIAPSRVPKTNPSGNYYIYNIARVIAIVFIVVVLAALIWRQIQQTQRDIAPAYIAAGSAISTTIHPATPTFTEASPPVTPVKIAFSGTNAKVLGPMEIPQGTYRAIFKTNGYGSVAISTSKGECGADMSGFMVPSLFIIMGGQASSGAEAILKSTGCTALIQITNVTEAWTLSIELVN